LFAVILFPYAHTYFASLIHAFEYLYSQIYAITMCQDPEVNMNILVLKDGVILM